VNGELVPLRHELRNGDMVEIITSPQAQPHEDWLQIVRTAGARSKVRHWLRQRRHDDSVALGREMLERELKRMRRRPRRRRSRRSRTRWAARTSSSSTRGSPRASLAHQRVRKLAPEKEGFAERSPRARSRRSGSGASRAAACASRARQRDGLVRALLPAGAGRPRGRHRHVGRGVSVHRQDCPNTFANRVSTDRRVEVEWGRAHRRDLPGAARGSTGTIAHRCSPTSPR
jgi:GTP pyrophosphokinase